jgi:hypothetical protein
MECSVSPHSQTMLDTTERQALQIFPIIDGIYLDIFCCKLDQQLEVEYIIGRDLEPGKIGEVPAALKQLIHNFLPCYLVKWF